ncbi:tetratricopeptide repeat protein 37 isoform X2 [Phlebotomus argentipes]|uniref:tetratricopeptide repeat protein 37 isoform X2 n=1 Tax=Phlebotomus argentipes TaxID=94469 RepID=UPI0028930248|nr:tetratricopeptide repeat protein 37 isoform X2 [Phlebotomus argentipes]
MSSDIKQSLKDANVAFKNKENDKAIRICKEVLRADPGNYMAHVLLGAIYQNSSKAEAEKYLRKALTLSKEPISALQGLAQCTSAAECPEIYGRLLALTPSKFEELHAKLLKVSLELPEISKTVEVFQKEISLDDTNENSLLKTLDVKDIHQQERYKKCLNLLSKLDDNDLLVTKAIEMHKIFRNDQYPLEWMCKIYLESCFPEQFVKEIPRYFESLLEKNPRSAHGLASKGLYFLNEGNVIEARTVVDIVLRDTPNWATALKLMAKIHFQTETFPLAAQIWEHLKQEEISLAECYIGQGYKLDKALEICNRLKDKENIDHLVAKTKILLKHDGILLNDGYLKAFSAVEFNQNYQEALDLLEKEPQDTLEYLLLKGEVLLKLERTNASLAAFTQAISVYPTSSRAFYWISRVHGQMQNDDLERENLQQCILLNPIHREALLRLCAIYNQERNVVEVEKLLLESALHAKDPSLKWVWLHLGLHYLSINQNDSAINTFRTLLRFDKKDYLGWEGLADAYCNNGSYTSALKIYQMIVEETENNIYCKYRVANMKTILGHYSEAINCFEGILEYQPNYVPALKGIAEAHFSLASVLMKQRRLGSMRDQLQKAAFYATRACELKSLCCHWSLLGNIFLKVANLPKRLAFVEVSSVFQTLDATPEGVVTLRDDEIYELSSKCFLRGLRENPKDPFLWYNLAACMYSRGCRSHDARQKEFLKKAMLYVKQSIALKSNRWQNWNMFGVISMKLGNVCQALHCFVKSLRLNKTSAMSWSNLGLMYLNEGEKWLNYVVDEGESQVVIMEEMKSMADSANRSANKAFGQSQQSNTEYMVGWIGQAITAERVNDQEAAMDLFRHCTQLGYHAEAAVGYSRFVCGVLNDPERLKEARYQYCIENMFALPRAHDSMTWCTADRGERTTAAELCLEGCLSYKSGLYGSASEAFAKALKITRNTKDADIIACNLAYTKLRANEFGEAIKAFERVQENTYRSYLGLAFSYFKDQQYEKSYEVYENLLQLETLEPLEQATILIAMSSMVYAFHGEGDTKDVLYQFLDLPNPPLEGFYAACALGILHKDLQLAELVVKELNKVEMSENSCHHIAFLSAQFHLLKEGKDKAIKYLLSLHHKYPHRAKLRKVVAGFILDNFAASPKHLKFASRLSQGVLQIEFGQIDKKCSPDSCAKCLMVSFKALNLLQDDSKKHLVQKAIHLNPSCKENWALLRSVA